MPIETIKRYTREQIVCNPEKLFVFGDNMARIGLGGQAGEARHCPNTIGIPTLWAPGMFFSDADLDNPIVMAAIDTTFINIQLLLDEDITVVFPEDGVGTGLADLLKRAPRIHDYIQHHLVLLQP